jgi:hypothetical protein
MIRWVIKSLFAVDPANRDLIFICFYSRELLLFKLNDDAAYAKIKVG